MAKNPPADAGDAGGGVQSLGQEDPLEEEMATHSSILAWEILWMEEPGDPPWGHKRVGNDLATKQQQQFKHLCFIVDGMQPSRK